MKIAATPLLCLSLALSLLGCSPESVDVSGQKQPPADAIHLVFTYGSEKEKWIKELTDKFHAENIKTASGKPIFVEAIAMGSGECVDEIIDGKREVHLTSPASEVFIKLGNAESQAQLGRDLVGKTENLVLSPVVIAMWQPMAEALGWPNKAIGWSEIHDLAISENGWTDLGFPQWGRFRFGHTHPEYSNSGLISLIAEVYAGAGKSRGLSTADVANPAVGAYLEEIESAVVHYGRSTGFFGRKMFTGGPSYLSAAVLYENMVIESYAEADTLPFPVVAIYPKEGTFYSDHPIGIVDRDYVTPEHIEAGQLYIDFLTDTPQQERALAYGFRPADVSVALGPGFSRATGVDPNQPQTTLETPETDTVRAILDLWQQRKKKANVVLVLDTSGSMNGENKMNFAKGGARQLIAMMGDGDQFSFLPFNHEATWMARDESLGIQRTTLTTQISSLFANGGTALYDAVILGHQHLLEHPTPDRITAMVVLSDGTDESSRASLEETLATIAASDEKLGSGVRIFTIGYGEGAREDVLDQIATATNGKFFKGTPENIEEIFKEISTFF
jgi:Ca-activated chloride channel family protein